MIAFRVRNVCFGSNLISLLVLCVVTSLSPALTQDRDNETAVGLEEICVSRSVCLAVLPGKAAHKPFIPCCPFSYWLKAIKISLQQAQLSAI